MGAGSPCIHVRAMTLDAVDDGRLGTSYMVPVPATWYSTLAQCLLWFYALANRECAGPTLRQWLAQPRSCLPQQLIVELMEASPLNTFCCRLWLEVLSYFNSQGFCTGIGRR